MEHLDYPLKGLITDWDERLERAMAMVKSAKSRAIPHQPYLWHAMETIRRMISHAPLAKCYQRLAKKVEAHRESRQDRPARRGATGIGQQQQEMETLRRMYEGQVDLLRAIEVMFYAWRREGIIASVQTAPLSAPAALY